MKISELIDGIYKLDVVLPEFQREYVWSKDQAKQLMVSLTQDYPVGSLLFWKTDNPPDLKNLEHLPEKLGLLHVTLDGQQRLTTLYMLITGEIPPYYTERDIQTDPRTLYFNLDTGEYKYYQASLMRGSVLWRPVVECFTNPEINVFQIAQQQASDESEAFKLAQRYMGHLTKLRQVKDIDLPVQTVPSHASVDDAIDIFDRVNSQGTKLTDAELALTHVTGKWPQARKVMKGKLEELTKLMFKFDLTFMVRGLTGVTTRRALFEMIHDRRRDELEAGWRHLSKILDYLAAILPHKAHIHSTDDLNTTNVLVPLIVYLAEHQGRFPNEQALNNALHWLYAAHTWSRYTSQTDQRLEQDVSLIVREESPWDTLRDQIIDQRGRIEVKASDLEGRGIQHPLFRMAYILCKARGAVDWFNGLPLGVTHSPAYAIHNHHIFPVSLLYGRGFQEDSHLHRKLVNEIANRCFLTAETNLSLTNRAPEQYLPEVEEKYPGALVRQFVPMDPDLWRFDRYGDFLAARRELMACKLNEFMAALITEPEIVHERPIRELIAFGESATLEFKSTLQWDMVKNEANKALRTSVLKTIAGFLNSAGGTLVIGVEDNGHTCGLRSDLRLTHDSTDRFQQLLVSLVKESIGVGHAVLMRIRFESADGEMLCVVDVDRAPEPAFLSADGGRQFYVRVGNTTHMLDAEEAVSYVLSNWT